MVELLAKGEVTAMGIPDVSSELAKAEMYCDHVKDELDRLMLTGKMEEVYCWMLHDVRELIRTIDKTLYPAVESKAA